MKIVINIQDTASLDFVRTRTVVKMYHPDGTTLTVSENDLPDFVKQLNNVDKYLLERRQKGQL